MLLTVGVPFVLANWVMLPVELFSVRLPSGTPLTVTPVSARLVIGGFNWPAVSKTKSVPTFCHATFVPVAVESVW